MAGWLGSVFIYHSARTLRDSLIFVFVMLTGFAGFELQDAEFSKNACLADNMPWERISFLNKTD
jgi:hypothetical protein